MADEVAGERTDRPRLRWLFVAAILSGSFLLFLVQPMVARMALPRVGGAPAVWNSAMLVYQALLLGGYAYAHWLSRVPPRMQAGIHLGVLALAALWLPIGLIATQLPGSAEPALWVPWLFGASIGPLFFAISAQAPLLQRWFSVASGGKDPYALYAASNIGSFGGLIAYPLLVEPMMTLRSQSWLWTGGYALVFALVGACALMLPKRAEDTPHVAHHSPAPEWRRVAHWIVLAFVPSGLMLATTTYLTTDIVAVPMLWVLPLGLYLLSFSLAFANRRAIPDVFCKFAPAAMLVCGATVIGGSQAYAYVNAFIALLLLFVVAVALHSRMYALRPAPDRLTGFYLAMSVGGALGGVFAGLIAPILFDWTWEYPLLILAAGGLAPQAFLLPGFGRLWDDPDPQWRRIKTFALALLVLLVAWFGIGYQGNWFGISYANFAFLALMFLGLLAIGKRAAFLITLVGAITLYGGYRSLQDSLSGARTRSYFGVYTVNDLPTERRLAHGTTLHGIQLKGLHALQPTTYYVPGSGIGQAMNTLPELFGANARVGVVGLGAGTLSCYAQPGQRWRFYEIDPAVVHIARDSGKFTFVSECLPHPDIRIGDARLRLAEDPAASLDLLALDAFSSDAVPMHLMTAEAFETYARVLQPKGLLLVHISNRYLDLAPVVAAAAERGGWHAMRLDYTPSAAERAQEAGVSDWIALSHDKPTLDRLTSLDTDWKPLKPKPGYTGWTDDYASIVPVLRPPQIPW
jgi:SAM-dependent methyltransferase